MRIEIMDAITKELLWCQEITPAYMVQCEHDVLSDAFAWMSEHNFNYIMRKDTLENDGEILQFYVMNLKGVIVP